MTEKKQRAWGTKDSRMSRAIHDYYLTDKTVQEIADDLNVCTTTVQNYLDEPPADEVRNMLSRQRVHVRTIAAQELFDQLRRVGAKSRSAEKPVRIYTDDNGDLTVYEKKDDDDEAMDKFAVPDHVEMGADEDARYYAREEVREILDQLAELVGASAPEEIQVEHTGETAEVSELKDAISNLRDDE